MGPIKPASAARRQVTERRVIGKIAKWSGKSGVIQPREPIKHPLAAKRQGQVLLALEDIEGPALEPGCHVSFHVYADSGGLGALACKAAPGSLYTKVPFGVIKPVAKLGPAGTAQKKLAATPVAARAASRPAPPKFPPPKAANKALIKATPLGSVKPTPLAQQRAAGSTRPAGLLSRQAAPPGQKVAATKALIKPTALVKPTALGKQRAVEGLKPPGLVRQADAKAKAKAKAAGGPGLPRVRLTEEPIFGVVVTWKKKMGWIEPDTPLDHPKAAAHQGRVYVNSQDIDGAEAVEEGTYVGFHLYEDQSGLGAEECVTL